MVKDPLTDIVRSLNLAGAVYLQAEFTEPWSVVGQITENELRALMPGARQVIAYHVVTRGEAIVYLDGHETCRARAGDVVFLPTNAECVMATSPNLKPTVVDDLLLAVDDDDGLVRLNLGGGGETTQMLCGFIASNAGSNPLLATMPRTLVISIASVATLRWIEASITMAANELRAGRLASQALVSQLSELLLIEALRVHLEGSPSGRGWLAGMADPRLARVLSRIHAGLASPPAVTELAEIAGMSRSAFVENFTDIMGIGPRRYVLDQRIEAARLLLMDSALCMAEIAHRVGYEAPEAFSRAFKRETGRSPADFRATAALPGEVGL